MNRNFFKSCIVIVVIGALIVGAVGVFWYLFYGGTSRALPVLTIIQPGTGLTIFSGQGVVVIVEGQSASGLDRIDLFVNGQLERSASTFGETTYQAVFPWFSSTLGNHEISAIGYDRGGRASQPASVMISVQGADIRTVLDDAQALDVNQSIEEIVAGAGGGAAQPGGAGQPDGNGQQPQAGDEVPVAELVVTPVQDGDSVVAHVQVSARDDTGVSQMRLIVQSPSGVPELTEYDCEGNLECSREFDRPLAEGGKWVFILTAVDLSGQVAQQQFASVDVICNAEVDANNQPFMNCAAADANIPVPGAPLPDNEPQGDGEPPTSILNVTPLRLANSVSAIVEISARDNVGLGLMNLEIRPPVGFEEQLALGCEANQDCSSEFVYPLEESGQWIFVLRAIDLSGQFSLPQLAVLQVICNEDVDENNQPIIACAIAEENIPAPGELPPGANAGDQRFLDPDAEPIIDPINAAERLLCRGIEPPQESFNVEGAACRVILPVNIPGGPFTNCPGGQASLLDADLRGVDLRNANFFRGDLRRTNLTCGADLRGADLRLALLHETRVTASTQLDAKWRLVWELVNLGGYMRDLIGVDLSEANLGTIDLFGANLNGAFLQSSDLRRVNFYAADLTGANLQGVTWGDTTCPDGTNSDNNGGTCEGILAAPLARSESFMIGDCTIILPVILPDGPFTDCEHDQLIGADLRHVDLRNANLFDVHLEDADLRGADLTGADLRGVRFSGAILDDTTLIEEKWRLVWSLQSRGARRRNLSGADLSWAIFHFLDMRGVILNGADLSHTDFRSGILEGAQFNGTIWLDTWCPDGTNSDDVGGTCENHLAP